MALLSLSAPYDFERSTGRFRAFGADLANLWHEGGLHRVVRRVEVRITAAPGGVDVDPFEPEAEPTLRTLVGEPFDLEAFAAFAAGAEPVLARIAASLGSPRLLRCFSPLSGSVSSMRSFSIMRYVKPRLVRAARSR